MLSQQIHTVANNKNVAGEVFSTCFTLFYLIEQLSSLVIRGTKMRTIDRINQRILTILRFKNQTKKQNFIRCISYNNIGFKIKMQSLSQFLVDHFHTYLYLFLG